MENKTIDWGFNEREPLNIRSKGHQEFLINQYNRNRPIEEQVNSMPEYIKALENNDVKYHGMRSVTITERRVYHKVGKITIELPKDLPLDETDEWLDNNKGKWEQALDNEFNGATLEYGLGWNNPSCDNMCDESADRETRYDVDGEKYGGHIL